MWTINQERGSHAGAEKQCGDCNCAVNTCGMDQEAENVFGGHLCTQMICLLPSMFWFSSNTILRKMAAHQKKQKAMLMRRDTENK